MSFYINKFDPFLVVEAIQWDKSEEIKQDICKRFKLKFLDQTNHKTYPYAYFYDDHREHKSWDVVGDEYFFYNFRRRLEVWHPMTFQNCFDQITDKRTLLLQSFYTGALKKLQSKQYKGDSWKNDDWETVLGWFAEEFNEVNTAINDIVLADNSEHLPISKNDELIPSRIKLIEEAQKECYDAANCLAICWDKLESMK